MIYKWRKKEKGKYETESDGFNSLVAWMGGEFNFVAGERGDWV